jgi:shikimate kinase
VAIIGFMGSGKSTVGDKLSHVLDREFIDLDSRIEENAGLSIPELFSKYGEPHFRELERAELESALEWECVVSCGGGVVENEQSRRLLYAATTVFLDEDPEVLYDRTREPARPLRGASYEDFLRRYEKRLPFYREADLVVDCRGRGAEEIAQEISDWLHG